MPLPHHLFASIFNGALISLTLTFLHIRLEGTCFTIDEHVGSVDQHTGIDRLPPSRSPQSPKVGYTWPAVLLGMAHQS